MSRIVAPFACACFRAPSLWTVTMTFRYSFTFPINGPNKLPRFKQWAEQHAPEVPISLPPQVPVKSEAMTIRLKSAEDRQKLSARLQEAKL
ncbi:MULTISPECIES: hypothetical protein [Phyllobacteriaceae]|nr:MULTISPECIES: hypothetical protein [Mesorhizobium]